MYSDNKELPEVKGDLSKFDLLVQGRNPDLSDIFLDNHRYISHIWDIWIINNLHP